MVANLTPKDTGASSIQAWELIFNSVVVFTQNKAYLVPRGDRYISKRNLCGLDRTMDTYKTAEPPS